MERRAPRRPAGRFYLGLAAFVAPGVLAGPLPAAAQTCTATITVRTIADAPGTCPGPSCSLRTAIAQANANPDCSRIAFDFTPVVGGYIALVSPLPTITTPVEIDGWSHPNTTRFPANGYSPGPGLRVGIRGDTNNIAGSGLRFLDAGYGLVQGLALSGFSTGAAIEVAASTNADQNVTIRENILGRWWQTDIYPTNRVGVSVQARGVHVGGGRTTDPNDPQGPLYFLDNSRGNYFRATTGPAIHVTTSPFGIQGRARIIGNHFDDYFFTSPLIVDLGPEGPTPNDPGDPDAGPNDLQNKPELLFEPMRFPPEEGDPPGPPCTASNNYADCDGVRVTVRLVGAPAGTYTAELLAGNIDPLLGDNPGIHLFLLTGAMTRTGSGDLDFEFEMGDGIELIGGVLAWFRSGGAFPLPPVRALISQGGIDSFDGATSEIVQAGDTSLPPPPTFTRYFAEGVGGSFFDTIFSLSNFGSAAATATMRFHTDAGQTVMHTVAVPAGGRPVTIDVDAVPGLNGAAFGTTITADQLLVASRTMRWDASGYGTHADNGVPAARTRWFLAEGVTGAFDTYVLVYNPNDSAAQLTMTFNRIAPNSPVVRTYTLQPHRRLTVAVDGVDPVLAATDVAIDVTSTNGVGVVVERSVYLSSATTTYEAGAASSAGEVGTQWYFGEGVASGTFDTFLLFYNPNAVAAQVQVRYMRRFGAPVTAAYTIAAGNRLSIWTDLVPGLDQQEFGMVVTSTNDVPVAVERAVWGGGAPFIDGHASQGLSTPSLRWGLNGGEADNAAGADTYILIVNPTIDNASARITLVFEDGTSSTPLTVPVPAQRRANVSVANQIPASNGRRFSILVESIGGEPVPLVVERSTYTSPGSLWRAGSNEVGTPLP
jgi:hypothetical protein